MPSRARNVDGLQSYASGTSSESGSGSHVTTITLAFGHCGFRLRAPIRSERAADIDFFFELTRLVAAEITFVTLVWFNQSPLAALRFGSCWHMVQIVRPPQATRIVISRAPSVRLTFSSMRDRIYSPRRGAAPKSRFHSSRSPRNPRCMAPSPSPARHLVPFYRS